MHRKETPRPQDLAQLGAKSIQPGLGSIGEAVAEHEEGEDAKSMAEENEMTEEAKMAERDDLIDGGLKIEKKKSREISFG